MKRIAIAAVVLLAWCSSALPQGLPPSPCGKTLPDIPECWQAYGQTVNVYRECAEFRGHAHATCIEQAINAQVHRNLEATQRRETQERLHRFGEALSRGLEGWGRAWEPAVRNPAPYVVPQPYIPPQSCITQRNAGGWMTQCQ
jgi:hypothetical protein